MEYFARDICDGTMENILYGCDCDELDPSLQNGAVLLYDREVIQ